MGLQGSLGGAAYGGEYSGAAVHHFDTGLHRPQRSAIRQAIIDRLGSTPTGNGKPLLKSAGGYLVKIAPLPRPLKGDSEEELAFIWIALQGSTPSLCVALGGMKISPIDGNEDHQGEIEVAVYSLSRNLRSFVDGRMSPDVVATADPTADPGVETMMEHVREILAGQSVDLIGVQDLRPKSEDEVCTDGDGTLWEQRFSVLVDIFVDPQRAESDVATSLEVRNDLDGLTDSQQPIVDSIFPIEVP